MKDRFDYNDLKDIAETFAVEDKNISSRIEAIKEICELPEVNIPWHKIDSKILYYYAENPADRLPCNAWWFKRMVVNDVGMKGVFLTNKEGNVYFDVI